MATTASLLPTFPRIFFLYIEPILITYGIFQTPGFEPAASEHMSFSTLIIPRLSNSYLFSIMLYGLIILLSSPPNKRLLKLHIWILAIADFTHWASLFSTLAQNDPRGWAAVLDRSKYEPDGLILALFPVFTLAIKFATLSGWFGRIEG